MLSERILQWVNGRVFFTVQDGFLPQFLSQCAKENIRLYRTKTEKNTLHGFVLRQDCEKLQAVARQCGMLLTVHKKRGLFFVLYRYRLRWGIPAGIALGILLMGILSSMVWQVQINGCENLSEEYVACFFEEMGVKPGVLRTAIDIKSCRDKALTEIEELLWVSLYFKGCTACIEVRERGNKVVLEKEGYSNLVASYGGEIIRADVYAGCGYVKIGQAVAAGDLLVGGGVPLKHGGVRFVRSKADIIARTQRKLETEIALGETVAYIEKTGMCPRLYWFGLQIPLLPLFGREAAEQSPSYLAWKEVVFPIGVCLQGWRKTGDEPKSRTPQTALLQAFADFARQELQTMQNKTIVERNVEIIKTDTAIRVVGVYICEENIAESKELQIEGDF